MKTKYLLLYLIFFLITSCDFIKGDKNIQKEDIIISKVHYKSNSSDIDTLWVSQNDTTVFKREEGFIHRPCSNPEPTVHYELIKPKDGAYYLIYNDKGLLIMEGKCTIQYDYKEDIFAQGNFYNSKDYYYESNGSLQAIHYRKDGRNFKIELFDSEKKLKEVIYFDKKSSDKAKVEIHKKGRLKETHIYTSFDNYYIEEAKDQ